MKRAAGLLILGLLFTLTGAHDAHAQDVPDAPSATRPVPPPAPTPNPNETKPDENLPDAPAAQPTPPVPETRQPPHSEPTSSDQPQTTAPPMPPIKTVPK